MDGLPNVTEPLPTSAKSALEQALPAPGLAYQVKHRTAGLGSLGLPRYVAVVEFEDDRMAREAKALVPFLYIWASNASGTVEYFYAAILAQAVRAHDPFTQIQGQWILRRLAPDCIRVEITSLPDTDMEIKLLTATGKETANVHLGSKPARAAIHQDLPQKTQGWLLQAASAMTAMVQQDWQDWKNGSS